ncbi:MAG: hypothetical protein ACLQHF_14365 [Terracidiphilus sp.]
MPGNSRSTRWLRNPLVLLALAAALIAIVVQSGELGSADTQHRENAAHALWTSDPPVFPYEYPEFGIHGRNGTLQTWYGIGQSLLMLPFDVAGTYIERLPVFADYNGNDPSVRNIVVSYGVNILLNVLTALVCFRFLRRFNFSTGQSAAGVLALLLLTTHLHYTQNMMENNYICLLTLAGFRWQLEWAQTGSRRALLIGSVALGLNLLTRLTTGLDLLGCALFVVLALWLSGMRGAALRARAKNYAAVTLPVYAFFILLDRLYQFYRFGSFTNTYAGIAARQWRAQNPNLPASFPFSASFHSGFFGALFTPEKSIFLFDPLLILMLLVVAVAWRRFTPAMRAYLIATAAMVLASISFYARYFTFAGDSAWGDRYVATTAELAALLAAPLLLQLWRWLGRAVRALGAALIAASAIVQAASVAFWLSLELYQEETLGHPTLVVWLRLKNVAAFALGKRYAWGLANAPMHRDPWDYVHITCWNFLPFLLRRVGEAPAWVCNLTLGLWWTALAALAIVLWRLWRALALQDRGKDMS